MRILINGQYRDTDQKTVEGLLEELEITVAMVAVELNAKVLRKTDFSETPLGEGDELEIVNFVGGG